MARKFKQGDVVRCTCVGHHQVKFGKLYGVAEKETVGFPSRMVVVWTEAGFFAPVYADRFELVKPEEMN